jgi:6-phosphogluconolactonase (cycloisomerase 2 family)
MAVDPSGKYLIQSSTGLSGGAGDVATFKVDQDSGALTFASGIDFGQGSNPFDVNADPLNRFVFVAYAESSVATQESIIALKFDPNTGVLTRSAAPVSVKRSHGLLPHPSGKYLYVLDEDTNAIAAFSVDSTNGALTAVAGSPFAVISSGTTGEIIAGAIDPSGKYLYVADFNASNIAAFAIDQQTGKLAAINGSPFAIGGVPSEMVIEPQGHVLYVSDSLGLSAYSIDNANGALSSLAGSPFAVAFGGHIALSY